MSTKKKIIYFLVGIMIVFVSLMIITTTGGPLKVLSIFNSLTGVSYITMLLVTLFLPFLLALLFERSKNSRFAVSKGLIYGGLIAIVYSFIDFFLKNLIGDCRILCGVENILFGFISVVYIVVGAIILIIIKIVIRVKSKQDSQIDPVDS